MQEKIGRVNVEKKNKITVNRMKKKKPCGDMVEYIDIDFQILIDIICPKSNKLGISSSCIFPPNHGSSVSKIDLFNFFKKYLESNKGRNDG